MTKDESKFIEETNSRRSKTAASDTGLALAFEELSQGKKEVLIEHHGQVYRLRATRNGGLILNK